MASDQQSEILLTERKLLSALNNLPPMPDLSKHINTFNAKIVAILCVVSFIIYHSILLARLGSDSCIWLLSDGRFQGSKWQPFGCMMHTYEKQDARACMNYIYYWKGRNYVVFMGDDQMKDLFNDFVALVDGSSSSNTDSLEQDKHRYKRKSLLYTTSTNDVNFYDDDRNDHYEDASIGLYVEFQHYTYLNKQYKEKLKEYNDMKSSHRPNTLVTGLPLCELRPDLSISNSSEQLWATNLREAAKLLEGMYVSTASPSDIDILWNLQDPTPDNSSQLSEHKQPSNRSSLVNRVIDIHNRAALEQFDESKIRLWKSSRLIAQIFQKNVSSLSKAQRSQLDNQILLNYKCNGNMYYHDGTCCTTTENPKLLQFLSAVFFVMCMSLSAIMFCVCRRDIRAPKTTDADTKADNYKLRNVAPPWKVTLYEILKGFSRLGIILAYVFLCDRTTFFMKENKSYSHLNFLFPLGYVMLIGLFWAKDSEYTTILHRDQTDEWKGWMQLFILVYHFTGASQVLPVYMFARCLVTSYMFLSAYGNFLYSWNTGDYSVHRYFTVVVRYNLLVICLCMVMNSYYQLYYFVPLVTFWYSIMFLTCAIWPRVNKQTVEKNPKCIWYLIAKLVMLIILTTLLHHYENVFGKIFSFGPIKPFFVQNDNTINDWKFRWSLDRYSSICGVLFALFVVLGHKYKYIDDGTNESSLFKSDAVFWVTSLVSVGSIVGYIIVVVMCSFKEQCNAIHSYAAFFPIIGYIFIRNLAGPIRTLYSPLFAWFGKFSLELFVAQYHIWLAADTNGILVLVPNYPVLNVLVVTLIFVCAAHELHQTTAKLTTYLVPNHWTGLARNFLIFIAFMVPVAIYSGAFTH